VPWAFLLSGFESNEFTYVFPDSQHWGEDYPATATRLQWSPPGGHEAILLHGNVLHYGGLTNGEKWLLFIPMQPHQADLPVNHVATM
jgi:hypothetical protein